MCGLETTLSNILNVIFSNVLDSSSISLSRSLAISTGRKLWMMLHGVCSATSSGSYSRKVAPFLESSFDFLLGVVPGLSISLLVAKPLREV